MRISLAVIAGCFGTGCSFDAPVGNSVDARPDVPDADEGPPTSCRALKAAVPTIPDTDYVIDPDGKDGPEMPRMVRCDMTTGPGGWTMIFVAAEPNLSTLSTYGFLSTKLMADATDVLLAYRDGAMVSAANYATFPIPGPWRTAAPFGYPGTDTTITVSVDGATPVSALLRYGLDNFNNLCSDGWNTAAQLGRICIQGTQAPYYNGFYNNLADNCSQSDKDWDAAGLDCAPTRRFSIAVR